MIERRWTREPYTKVQAYEKYLFLFTLLRSLCSGTASIPAVFFCTTEIRTRRRGSHEPYQKPFSRAVQECTAPSEAGMRT
jgi:hypothetical protein